MLVNRPVAPRQIPEVLERVVERVVHSVDQEQPEARDWASEGLVILLAVDGVNHAGQVVMAQLDQVGAHPPDLSAVLGEREDVQELMLHGCGLLYRVQLPELGALGEVDQLFKKSGDLHGWSEVVEVHPVRRRVTKTVSAVLLLAIGYQTKENPPYAFATMGPRIPGIIASPMVKPGSVCSTLFDHTSVLQFLAETFTPGQPYSNDVDARKQQGIASLSAALADQPQRAKNDIPAVPAQPIPVASALGDNIAAPPRTAMQSAFELAAKELLKQHPVETTKKFPELVHWKAAVDAAR